MTSTDHLLNFYQERINALEKENARLNGIIENKKPSYLKLLVNDPIFEKPLKETNYGKVS